MLNVTGAIAYRTILVSLLLSACSSGSSAGPDTPPIELHVEFHATAAADANVASVQCGPLESGTGFLAARVQAACILVAANKTLFTEPVDSKLACTQIYGGPETARVTGTLDGRRVDRSFHRADGCGISDWEKVKAVIDPRS
jgi:hypothetical protein